MPLDHYVTLGRSGLRVSPMCLGAMTFGLEWGNGSSPEESVRILDAFLARGGNFIDTANGYTKGHSEKIIGDHLGRHPARRERVVIATKFFGSLFPGDPNAGGAGRKSIIAACEHSLRRLQTDYIDLYWMHCWDRFTPIDETMRALDDLVRAGKTRYIGFSDTPAWKCAQAQGLAQLHGWAPLVGLQIEYSLLERTVEGDLIPMAQELGLGVTPWSPLKGGVLTGKHHDKSGESKRTASTARHVNERSARVIDAMRPIASAHGATLAAVALAWLGTRPGVSSTIIGARTMEQLEANLAALDLALSPEELAALDEASRPQLPFPHDFIANSAAWMQNGTTINGRPAGRWPLGPEGDHDRH